MFSLSHGKEGRVKEMVKILGGIFAIVLIVRLVALIILMALLIYELIPEDLKKHIGIGEIRRNRK